MGLIVVVLLLAGSLPPATTLADDDRPPRRSGPPYNVLLLMLDDLNDWVGHLGGHPQALTPNIDRLAAQGVAFRRAYSPLPLCNPSRVAILTGRFPTTTNILRNAHDGTHLYTLDRHFQVHGYRTIVAGKVFHDHRDPWNWDEELRYGRPSPRPPQTPVLGVDIVRNLDAAPLDAPDAAMQDHARAERVAQFLGREQQEPFFLAFGVKLPHKPWYVPRASFDLFPLPTVQLPAVLDDDLDDLPAEAVDIAVGPHRLHEHVLQANAWRPLVRGYLAATHFADAAIGRVLEALETSRYRHNTIVVLLSDHGFHLGEKQHWAKFFLSEDALHVPFVIKRPSAALVHGPSDRPVSLVDLFPTLCDLAGIPPPAGLDGRSLVPLLDDPAAEWDHPVVSIYDREARSVRTARWRYTRYPSGAELYDHDRDPHEWHNLADVPEYAAVLSELDLLLATHPSSSTDFDADGVLDWEDNCSRHANPGQSDFDADGIGDACETGALLADADRSWQVDGLDLAALARRFGMRCGEERYAAAVDFDRTCAIDGDDLAILSSSFGQHHTGLP